MAFTPLSILPAAPQRSDPPDDFADTADTFVAALKTFSEQINLFIGELETAAALINTAPAYADPGLRALAGNTPAADKVAYYTGAGTSALAALTGFARQILDDADAAAMRTTLGLGTAATQPSTAFEVAGASSSALATHTGASDPHSQYLLESAVSAFMATMLDDADAATARATLGVAGAIALSGGATGGKLEIPLSTGDLFKIQWQDVLVGSSGVSVTYPYAFSSWSRAICGSNAGGSGATQVYVTSGSFITTGCFLENEGGTTTALVLSWGV